MNVETYIEHKMGQYSEAFDFYIDSGLMPENIPHSDILGRYIRSVVDDNPQLDKHDPLWTELLKDDLMNFIHAMLQMYIPIELDYERQLDMIDSFSDADIDCKRQMWDSVYSTLSRFYTSREVNVAGYLEQMRHMDGERKHAALSMLSKDWAKANEERRRRMEKELLDRHKDRWEASVREHAQTDYNCAKKVENEYYRYPALRDIVRIMGREKQPNIRENDSVILKYKPRIQSDRGAFEEVEEITTGNDLGHMVPSEIAMMSDALTEPVFYHKYVTGKLQLFANRPAVSNPHKTDRRKRLRPRLQMGPIIVCVDTSASMSGRPERIAKSLLLQIVRMSKGCGRKCFLISFSVRARGIDLARPANWGRLRAFLDNGFSGGTDGEEMLRIALDVLNGETYDMADVLIVSDFKFMLPLKPTCRKIDKERAMGVRFYGLQTGGWPCEYEKILDKVWKV